MDGRVKQIGLFFGAFLRDKCVVRGFARWRGCWRVFVDSPSRDVSSLSAGFVIVGTFFCARGHFVSPRASGIAQFPLDG